MLGKNNRNRNNQQEDEPLFVGSGIETKKGVMVTIDVDEIDHDLIEDTKYGRKMALFIGEGKNGKIYVMQKPVQVNDEDEDEDEEEKERPKKPTRKAQKKSSKKDRDDLPF